MPKTIQTSSQTLIDSTKMQYATSSLISTHLEKPSAEDDVSLMLSLCDSANELCITLEKLHHAMKIKKIETEHKPNEKE